MLIDLSIVFLLLLLNSFFAMAEMALVSARRGRLRQRADEGSKGARIALLLAEDQSSLLSTVQIGVTLGSVLTGAYSGAALAEPFGAALNDIPFIAPYGVEAAFALTVTIVSFLSLVVGELVPKRIGLAKAESIAVAVAPFMRGLELTMAPVVWILKASTNLVLRIFRLGAGQGGEVTEEEVKDLIAEGTESGVFAPAEKEMLEGVMALADRSVRKLMTPRMDVVWLCLEDDNATNRKLLLESEYSRLPLARGDMEEVIGIVDVREAQAVIIGGGLLNLRALAYEALVVPDTTSVLRLLDQFKRTGGHMAIITDEYGSVEGVATLTDVVESIVGDLPDMGEESEDKPVLREDGSWLFDGMTPIDEVEATLETKGLAKGGDYHTIAGFVIDKLGRLPSAGDHFMWEETRFEVVDMDARRVDKVLVLPPSRRGEDDAEID